jgi:hypothetical protein
MRALNLENEMKFEESLKLVFLIIEGMKKMNKAFKLNDLANA